MVRDTSWVNSSPKNMHSINIESRNQIILQKNNTSLPPLDRDLPRNIQRAIQIVAVGGHPEILPANPTLRVMVCELLRCLSFKAPRSAVLVRKSFLADRLGKGPATIYRYLDKLEELGVIRRSDQSITRREGAQIGEIFFTDAALLAMGFLETPKPTEAPPPITSDGQSMIDAKRVAKVRDASNYSNSSLKKHPTAGNQNEESGNQAVGKTDQRGSIPQELTWLTTLPRSPLTAPQIFMLMGKCRKAYGCNLSVIALRLQTFLEQSAISPLAVLDGQMKNGKEWFRSFNNSAANEAIDLNCDPPPNQFCLQSKAKEFEGIPFLASKSGFVLTVINGVIRRFNPTNIAENIGDVGLTNEFFDAIADGRLVKYHTA